MVEAEDSAFTAAKAEPPGLAPQPVSVTTMATEPPAAGGPPPPPPGDPPGGSAGGVVVVGTSMERRGSEAIGEDPVAGVGVGSGGGWSEAAGAAAGTEGRPKALSFKLRIPTNV